MFQWDKSVKTLGVSVDSVLHLFRSMRALQLTLPGMPVQQSTAYLCQYKSDAGVVTVAVFHLEKSNHLAFYYQEPRSVDEQQAGSLLDEGMHFVESMGFLLADLDLHLLESDDQEMLWDSLPLRNGLPEIEPPAVDNVVEEQPAAPEPTSVKSGSAGKKTGKTATAPQSESRFVSDAVSELTAQTEAAKPTADLEPPAEEVDDLLAAVSAMRANRPGLRARKSPPPIEELIRRRTELRENLGRILASL